MIECKRDETGACRVDVKDMHPLIGSFLHQDVQASHAFCQELLDLVDEVVSGARPSWEGTGNAHTVIILPDKVTIENEWDDSLGVAELSPADFRKCVQIWCSCVSS